LAGYITCYDIPEAHHAVDLSPAMLTNPAVTTSVVPEDGRRENVASGILRRALIRVPEVKAGHDTRVAIWIGQ
jgi:hypothetical protein